MTVDRENTWNEIVKKGYRYAGNELSFLGSFTSGTKCSVLCI